MPRGPIHPRIVPPYFKVKIDCNRSCKYFKKGLCNRKKFYIKKRCYQMEDILDEMHKKVTEKLYGKKAKDIWRIA